MLKEKNFAFLVFLIGIFLMVLSLNRPVESAKRYEYHVVSITGMKELRTQSDAEQGRMMTIEKTIRDQASQGWEFYQADGYVLYFRR
jgi:hypothetical protein